MANEVRIRVTAQDDTKGVMSGLKKGMVAVAAGALAMGTAVVKGAGYAIKQASDLNETVNKSQVIFGKMQPVVAKFASTAAKDLGLSRQAAMEAAASFGDMFLQLGFGSKVATRMSLNVVRLSADLGSFNNLPTADVQERIAAAFRGEYDSLQALVPTINAATVQQRAMADTGKKSAEKLTQQEKAAATLAIVMDSTARAQGDFAKTSDSMANSLKIVRARIDDLAAKAGKKLLPFVQDALKQFNNFLDRLENDKNIKRALDALGDTFKTLGKEDLSQVFDGIIEDLPIFINHLNTAIIRWDKFTKMVDKFEESTGEEAGGPLGGMANAMERGDKRITEILKGLRGRFVGLIKKMWGEAKDSFKENHSAIIGDVKRWVIRVADWIGKLPGRAKSALSSLANKIGEEVEQAKDRALNKAKDMVNRFVNFVKGIPGKSKAALSPLSSRIGAEVEQAKDNVLRKARDMVNRFIDRMQELVRKAKDQAGRVKGAITGRFAGAGRWLLAEGKAVINGLLDGLKNRFDRVKSWVSGIAKWIKDHKGPVSLDRQLLVPAGKALMGGLLEGLKFGFGGVGDFVFKAGTSVKDIIGQIKDSFLGDWSGKLGSVKGGSNKLLNAIRNTFGIGGGTYPGHGERGASKAWDFMARGRLGDAIAAFAKTFARQLGVLYVIWNRRIWNIQRAGEGWRPYTRSNPHTDHVHVSMRDRGGMLWPGQLGGNMSGRPERVLSPAQTQSFDRLVKVMDRGRGAGMVENHYHFDKYIGSKDELIQFLSTAKRQGRLDVILR